ncbi:MAG: hypothetical protein AB7N80_12130, partial [Bdellovibrionales bacterium]
MKRSRGTIQAVLLATGLLFSLPSYGHPSDIDVLLRQYRILIKRMGDTPNQSGAFLAQEIAAQSLYKSLVEKGVSSEQLKKEKQDALQESANSVREAISNQASQFVTLKDLVIRNEIEGYSAQPQSERSRIVEETLGSGSLANVELLFTQIEAFDHDLEVKDKYYLWILKFLRSTQDGRVHQMMTHILKRLEESISKKIESEEFKFSKSSRSKIVEVAHDIGQLGVLELLHRNLLVYEKEISVRNEFELKILEAMRGDRSDQAVALRLQILTHLNEKDDSFLGVAPSRSLEVYRNILQAERGHNMSAIRLILYDQIK